MPTVVIIHAAEDTLAARALAEKLRMARLNVVLEKPPGSDLREALKSASVTVALWSQRSISQPALADDVNFARGKSKVFHACMQSTAPPEAFRSDKSVNLTGWRGEDDFPAWRELAKLVTDKMGVAPLPPPAPRGPPGFFQPGRPVEAGPQPAAPRAPQQRAAQTQQRPAPRPQPQPRSAQRPDSSNAEPAPSSGGGRGLLFGLIALVVLAGAAGGGYYFWSQSQATTTTSAWEGVDRNDAAALRAFLDSDPGEYREEAQTALAELEERTYEAASDADTIEAFEAFLNDFPDSEHAIGARGRIAELRTIVPQQAGPLPPSETPADPDLVPPGVTPEASGGPAPLTPPAEEAPPAEAPPAPAPTN